MRFVFRTLTFLLLVFGCSTSNSPQSGPHIAPDGGSAGTDASRLDAAHPDANAAVDAAVSACTLPDASPACSIGSANNTASLLAWSPGSATVARSVDGGWVTHTIPFPIHDTYAHLSNHNALIASSADTILHAVDLQSGTALAALTQEGDRFESFAPTRSGDWQCAAIQRNGETHTSCADVGNAWALADNYVGVGDRRVQILTLDDDSVLLDGVLLTPQQFVGPEILARVLVATNAHQPLTNFSGPMHGAHFHQVARVLVAELGDHDGGPATTVAAMHTPTALVRQSVAGRLATRPWRNDGPRMRPSLDPVIIVDGAGNLRRWRPWDQTPPEEPLLSVSGDIRAISAGNALVWSDVSATHPVLHVMGPNGPTFQVPAPCPTGPDLEPLAVAEDGSAVLIQLGSGGLWMAHANGCELHFPDGIPALGAPAMFTATVPGDNVHAVFHFTTNGTLLRTATLPAQLGPARVVVGTGAP
ncbi:MAG: hypothetical protein AB2A00_13345 [Myxococcota bacterium]